MALYRVSTLLHRRLSLKYPRIHPLFDSSRVHSMMLLTSLCFLGHQLGAIDFLKTQWTQSDSFTELYVQPTFPNAFPPAPGTTWSLAGMVASQCSIPLKPDYGNSIDTPTFLPSLVCLGNILQQQGYMTAFLTGTELAFSGMNTFYESHGITTLIGVKEWRQRFPHLTASSWGKRLPPSKKCLF